MEPQIKSDRRSERPTLFLLQTITDNQQQTGELLRKHIVQEDRRFDQILNEIHALRVKEAQVDNDNTLKGLLTADLRPLKVISAVGYLVMAMSLILYHPDHDVANDMRYLLSVMSSTAWAGLFGLMFALRASGLVSTVGARYLHITVPAFGLWLWSMVLTSFAVLSKLESVGLLLLIPILIEIWIVARSYRKWRQPHGTH